MRQYLNISPLEAKKIALEIRVLFIFQVDILLHGDDAVWSSKESVFLLSTFYRVPGNAADSPPIPFPSLVRLLTIPWPEIGIHYCRISQSQRREISTYLFVELHTVLTYSDFVERVAFVTLPLGSIRNICPTYHRPCPTPRTGELCQVAPFTAISSLVQLLSETKKGINLMIMVVSKGTITSTTLSNYNLFVNALTKNKIPLVFVVTHCERERGDMQGWVNENEHDIRERGISPREILATTFIIPDPEFDNVPLMTAKMRQSKELLWHAIHRWSTSQPINFQGERQEVVEIVRKCYNAIAGRIGCRLVWVTTKFVDLVQAVGNLSRADARNVAKRLEGKKKIERLPPPC